MADSNINIKINAIDNASRNIKLTNDQLIFLGQTATKANTGLSGTDKAAKKTGLTFSKVKSAVVGLNQGLELMKKVARGAQQALDFAEGGKSIENAEARLAAFVGGAVEAEKVINAMDEALDGGATRFEIATEASRMFELRLASSAEEAAMLSLAITTTGGNMNDFSLMIANESYRRLDLYGIAVSDVKNRMKVLAIEQKELTSQERFAIATKAELTKKMKLLEDAGYDAVTSYDKLRTATGNFTDELKVQVNEGIEPAIKGLAELLEKNNKVREASAILTRGVKVGIITQKEMNKIYRETFFDADAWIAAAEKVDEALKHTAAVQKRFYEEMAINSGEYIIDVEAEAEEERLAAEAIIKARKERYDVFNKIHERRMDDLATFTDLEEGYLGDLEDANKSLGEIEEELADARARKYAETGTKIQGLIAQQDEEIAKIKEVEAAHETAKKKIIFGLLERKFAADGIITEEESAYLEKMGIEWGIYSQTGIDELNRVHDEYLRIYGLFQDKTVLFTAKFVTEGTTLEGTVEDDGPTVSGSSVTGISIFGKAGSLPPPKMEAYGTRGQWQTVPPGYDHDNYLVGLMSDEKYMVKSRGEALSSTGNYINVNIMESASPRATGDAVVRALKVQGVFAS